jgi:branched-chain amino acid aminotransferase
MPADFLNVIFNFEGAGNTLNFKSYGQAFSFSSYSLTNMITFINDHFIEEEASVLNIRDLSIQRGFAVFDFFRTRNYIPLFLNHYLDRFFNSAAMIGLQPLHTKEELKGIINELIFRNKISETGFKMILTGGYSADSFEPASPNFILQQQPLQLPAKEKFHKGINIILHEYMRDLPEIKSTNYLMAIWLLNKMKQQKADEVLYVKDNRVLEFPRSNVFAVTKNQTVVTPDENVLNGITRMMVLQLAEKKYKVEKRQVTIDELLDAAEVFLTSTTRRILPVLKINDQIISDGKPGAITIDLYNSFLKLEDEFCK